MCLLVTLSSLGCATFRPQQNECLRTEMGFVCELDAAGTLGGLVAAQTEKQARVANRIKELYPKINQDKADLYAGLFLKYSREYNLDVNMLVHICFMESRFSEAIVSRTGDYGLMQINWSAHKKHLTKMGIDQKKLLDPAVNIEYACRILSIFSEGSNDLYGIIRRYAPTRPQYYTQKLQRLMADSSI